MKRIFIAFTLLILCFGCSAQNDIYKRKVNNVVNVEEMPYFSELSGDTLFWELTTDRRIIPYLIERISDTTKTKAPVLFFGGNYTIGDMCFEAICKLIPDMPAVYLITTDKGVISDKGYGVYWEYIRGSLENRKEFQNKVRLWYKKNKSNLVWVKDNKLYPIEDRENSKMRRWPAGGFYSLKK